MPPPLVLCAYDVRDGYRLAKALDRVTGWSHGGQRSAFECFAGGPTAGRLAADVGPVLAAEEDQLGVFRPAASRSFTLGIGRIARLTAIVYIG